MKIKKVFEKILALEENIRARDKEYAKIKRQKNKKAEDLVRLKQLEKEVKYDIKARNRLCDELYGRG